MYFRFNHVELYRTNNFLQAKNVEQILKEYSSAIKRESIRKVIDIGCGPGTITYNQVLPLIPEDGELVSKQRDVASEHSDE